MTESVLRVPKGKLLAASSHARCIWCQYCTHPVVHSIILHAILGHTPWCHCTYGTVHYGNLLLLHELLDHVDMLNGQVSDVSDVSVTTPTADVMYSTVASADVPE